MIQLHVAEQSTERMYQVVLVIRCVLEQKELLCVSYVMSRWFRMVAL